MHLNIKSVLLIVALLFVLLLGVLINANHYQQLAENPTPNANLPDLFIPLPTNQRQMSPAQTQRINQINQRPTTESVTLVRVDADTLKSDSIRTSLPGGAKTLSFSKSNIEMRSVNDFTWFGTLSGVPGNAIFVVHDGDITGTIRDDSNLYSVEPVGNGVHALIKVDQSRFPPD